MFDPSVRSLVSLGLQKVENSKREENKKIINNVRSSFCSILGADRLIKSHAQQSTPAMTVKTKGKPKGKGKSKPKAQANKPEQADAPPRRSPLSVPTFNHELWTEHSANVAMVMAHPVFKDILQECPSGIISGGDDTDDTGFQAAFNAKQGMVALKKTGRYLSSVNMAWVDPLYISVPDVPLIESSVDAVAAHFMSDATEAMFFTKVEIVLTAAQVDAGNWESKGKWRRTSPEEIMIAWYRCIAKDIVKGAPEETLLLWRHNMVNMPGEFVKVDSEGGIPWRAKQLREDIKATQTLGRTSIQRIFDLQSLRVKHSIQNPKKMSEFYNENLNVNKDTGTEQVTESFCDTAFTIWDRALSIPTVQACILAEEQKREQSLLAGSSKLQLIINKAKSQEHIEFVFEMVVDAGKNATLKADQLSNRQIEGKSPGQNGKGIIDTMVFKKKLLTHLIDVVLAKAEGMYPRTKAKIRESCASFAAFRAAMGYTNGDLPDQTWRAGWPQSADAFMSIVEDFCATANIYIASFEFGVEGSGRSRGSGQVYISVFTKWARDMRLWVVGPAKVMRANFESVVQDAIYHVKHDECIRTAVRAAKAPEDACDTGSLEAALSTFHEALKAEQAKADKDTKEQSAPDEETTTDIAEAPEMTPTDHILKMVQDATGTKLDDEKKGMVAEEESKVRRLVNANLTFATIPKSAKKTVEIISNSPAGKVRGQGGNGSFVGVFVDPSQMGEPATAPHIRAKPINQEVVKVPQFKINALP